MKTIAKRILVGLLILKCMAILAQPINAKALQKVDSIFTSHFDPEAPGGAFAVLQNGNIVYKKTLGLANLEHRIPVTDTTVFNIASNSKQMTTFLALLLEEEGKLSFTDDISKYLPELKQLPYKITIKQLTNHTHGLPNVDELAQLKGIHKMTHSEVVNMLFEIKQFNFAPESDYVYGNTGYVLLAEIIERVGEKPFEEQLKERIFTPLGMNSLAIGNYDEIVTNKAYSYSQTQNGYRNQPLQTSTMGASGVYASLNDLIIWAQNFQKTSVEKVSFFQQMQRPTQLSSGEEVEYGMGLQFENYKDIDIVFHGGGTEGYRSYMLHAPTHRLSFVFLSNAGGFAGLDVVYKSLEALLTNHLVEEENQVFDARDLAAFEGTYELNPGSYYTIKAEKDTLVCQIFGTEYTAALPRIGQSTFKFAFPHSKVIFHKHGFDLRFADFTYPAKRVQPPAIKHQRTDLDKYIGIYKNNAHNISYELLVLDDQLVARHHSDGDTTLSGYPENGLFAINSSFGRIDFMFDTKGNVKGFKLSRKNLIGLEFVKQ